MREDSSAAALRASRDTVLTAFAAVADIERRPEDGGWNAWEVAYHLLDLERWYIAKLCEAVSADRPGALARFLGVWSRLRDETIALARALPPERLDQAGVLSGVPDWTPRTLLDAISAHDQEHAAQVRRAGG
jgi:hypothetical protein